MNSKAKFLKVVAAAMIGLTLGVGVAQAASTVCSSVPMTVVNGSAQDISIRGASGITTIQAHSTKSVAFKSNHFYTKCGLVEVSTDGQTYKRGLINEASNAVDINVQPNGNLQAVGLTEPGFKLDDYISWWGLSAVLA